MIRFSRRSSRALGSRRFSNIDETVVYDRNNSTIGLSRRKPSLILNKLLLYAELSKFRLSSMVVVTSGAGYLSAGVPFEVSSIVATCLGTGLCAASASTYNQIFERQYDASMKRCQNRPLPSGKVALFEAHILGLSCGVGGTAILATMANPVTAALGVANIALYAGVYTYSKRKTEFNTWIGALVGAIPPVMGWAAATGGSALSPEPMALASLLLLWQFPHFFALSWLHRQDYARGGFKMVAVNDATGYRTSSLILEYSAYLAAFPLIMSVSGLTSWMYAVEGTAANIYLLNLGRKFHQDRSNANARRVFLCSLWYLPVMLGGYLFHSHMWNSEDEKVKESAGVIVWREKSISEKVSLVLVRFKEISRGLCLHEVLAYGDVTRLKQYYTRITGRALQENTVKTEERVQLGSIENGGNFPQACMKLGSENAISTATANAKSASSSLLSNPSAINSVATSSQARVSGQSNC